MPPTAPRIAQMDRWRCGACGAAGPSWTLAAPGSGSCSGWPPAQPGEAWRVARSASNWCPFSPNLFWFGGFGKIASRGTKIGYQLILSSLLEDLGGVGGSGGTWVRWGGLETARGLGGAWLVELFRELMFLEVVKYAGGEDGTQETGDVR